MSDFTFASLTAKKFLRVKSELHSKLEYEYIGKTIIYYDPTINLTLYIHNNSQVCDISPYKTFYSKEKQAWPTS